MAAQVVQESATQSFLAQRRRDQQRALQLLRDDPGLGCAWPLRLQLQGCYTPTGLER